VDQSTGTPIQLPPVSERLDKCPYRSFEFPWIYVSNLSDPEVLTKGYGANFVFLHPFEPGLADSAKEEFVDFWTADIAPPSTYSKSRGLHPRWITADTSCPEACWKAVNQYIADAKSRDPDFPGFTAVVSYDEFSISSAAYLAEKLSLPGTPFKTVNEVRNKQRMREMCRQVGLPAPRSARIHLSELVEKGPEKVLTEACNLVFPLVMKPLSGAGSNFVRKVTTPQELLDVVHLFMQQCAEITQCPDAVSSSLIDDPAEQKCTDETGSSDSAQQSSQSSSSSSCPNWTLLQAKWRHWGLSNVDSSFMLEELLVGSEVDADVIVEKGIIRYLSINDNFPCAGRDPSYFMEAGGMCPSAVAFEEQIAIRALVYRFIKHCAPDITGILHFEAMVVRPSQPYSFSASGSDESKIDVDSLPFADRAVRSKLLREWGIAGDDYVAVPIEVNQRLGGSEVASLTSSIFGVHLGIEAIMLACKGAHPRPQYFSLLPEFDDMNRIGWDQPPFEVGAVSQLPENLVEIENELASRVCGSLPKPSTMSVLPSRRFKTREEALQFVTRLQAEWDLPPAIKCERGYDYTLGDVATAGPTKPLPRARYVCSINFVPPTSGVIEKLELQHWVHSDPSYRGSTMWAKPGTPILVPPEGFDFLGFLIAAGNTPAEAQYNLHRLSAALEWKYQDDNTTKDESHK